MLKFNEYAYFDNDDDENIFNSEFKSIVFPSYFETNNLLEQLDLNELKFDGSIIFGLEKSRYFETEVNFDMDKKYQGLIDAIVPKIESQLINNLSFELKNMEIVYNGNFNKEQVKIEEIGLLKHKVDKANKNKTVNLFE